MGKIPPFFRSAISNPFLRRPSSLVPAETSQLTVTPSGKPHYPPKKTSNKKPSQLPGKVKEAKDSDPSTTQKALKLFKSPSLSDAKDVFDSFIKSSKTFIDHRS
ncbi:hypothetical protein K1719_046658 [Acacia pycnantha]|nr:hypothetical protein K1719_046658 [Acacia pycnantha]